LNFQELNAIIGGAILEAQMRKVLVFFFVMISSQISYANAKISNLIIPVSYFVNHIAQLDQLEDHLKKYNKVSLVGTSGIGKTQVARTYAYNNKAKYEIIWFIDCNVDLNSQFVRLAKELNSKFNTGVQATASSAIKETIDFLQNREKVLIVFDNLKVGDNYKVFQFVKQSFNGHMIFCSQDSEKLPQIIEILKFNKENIAALAKHILETDEAEIVNFLENNFHGYPVLIVQASRLLKQVKGLDAEVYKKLTYKSADKIKTNIELANKSLNKSAREILAKVALLNNQSFSKKLLSIIAPSSSTLSEDIYNLSKFALIVNVDSSVSNPIYEMHDVIANKIQEINSSQNSKLLEEIVDFFTASIPKKAIKAHLFREEPTIFTNLEVLNSNIEKNKIDLYKEFEIKQHLLIHYVNTGDLSKAQELINWFQASRIEEKKTNLTGSQKDVLVRTLGAIGWYYIKVADYDKAIYYLQESLQTGISSNGLSSYISNAYFGLALSNIYLGKIEEAQKDVDLLQEMFDKEISEKSDIGTLYSAKSRLYYIQGKYKKALEYSNKTIETYLLSGFENNDKIFDNLYLLKAEIFNSTDRYDAALEVLNQLDKMHNTPKSKKSRIYGRILVQHAKTSLGLGEAQEAIKYAMGAVKLLDSFEIKADIPNPKDPYLAQAYVALGDSLVKQKKFEQAIKAYCTAQKIYFYLYRDNSKYAYQVSYMYLQGAKASCKAKDQYHYQSFGKPQIREFGRQHPNSVSMLEYCKDYNMDLWRNEG